MTLLILDLLMSRSIFARYSRHKAIPIKPIVSHCTLSPESGSIGPTKWKQKKNNNNSNEQFESGSLW